MVRFHTMAKNSLSIIIVNWNGMQFLPPCLVEISRNLELSDYEVFVVDNVSTDGSREWLNSDEANEIFPPGRLKVILSDKNIGFARANNKAIEHANGDLIFILNPDTILQSGAVERLTEALVSDDRIGAVSPKLLNPDGSLQESIADFASNPVSILYRGLHLSRPYDHTKLGKVPVFWGTAILAKRKMIEEIGAFDPDFFMYGEDVEWCVRMNRNGWQTVFVPDAEVVHLGGRSSEQAWKASETSLRKEAADLLVQKKCLPAYLVGLNSITKAGLYSAAYLRRWLTGEPRDFLSKHIRLHFNECKSSLLAVLSVDRNNKAK